MHSVTIAFCDDCLFPQSGYTFVKEDNMHMVVDVQKTPLPRFLKWFKTVTTHWRHICWGNLYTINCMEGNYKLYVGQL